MNSSSVVQSNARDAKSSVEGSKHTPGPWHNQTMFRSIYAMSGGTSGLTIFVAKAEGHQCGEEQADANARLIAAAPDLLTELRALLVAVTYAAPPRDFGTPGEEILCFDARVPVEFVDRARAAIAKATGEPSPADTASPDAGTVSHREEPQ